MFRDVDKTFINKIVLIGRKHQLNLSDADIIEICGMSEKRMLDGQNPKTSSNLSTPFFNSGGQWTKQSVINILII